MADSIPSLRRKLDEANAEIARLREAAIAPAVVYVDKLIDVPREVERIVYVDNPEHIATIRVLQERLAKCQS